MRVDDYMSNSPVTVRDDADYDMAFEIMETRDMHHLPVLAADQCQVVSARRDLQLAARCFREAPVEISEVMHTPVLTAASGSPLSFAARQMMENHIGCLPVMDGENHVVGMLTETDLFRALSDLLDRPG